MQTSEEPPEGWIYYVLSFPSTYDIVPDGENGASARKRVKSFLPEFGRVGDYMYYGQTIW